MDPAENVTVTTHEPDEPRVRNLVLFGIALVAMIVIALAVAGWAFSRLSGKSAREPAPPLTGTQVPPEPRLQVTPQLDLRRMREQESRNLETYRWVNRQNGLISIPIEQAIDYVAQHGLPAALGPNGQPVAPRMPVGLNTLGATATPPAQGLKSGPASAPPEKPNTGPQIPGRQGGAPGTVTRSVPRPSRPPVEKTK